jgi:hypothetical protein
MLDVQMVTLIEASLLLVTNLVGGALALLAWRVSDVDVREARAWKPPIADPVEYLRVVHNRRIVNEDQRFGEALRFISHGLIAVIGVFWLVAPQPTNPDVTWWAVLIRAGAVALSCVLIAKSLHHLTARWRFDRPGSSANVLVNLWPALWLAHRDVWAPDPAKAGEHAP